MAKLIRVNRNPSPGELRLFGLLLTAALAAVGFMLYRRGGTPLWPAVLGCAAGLAALPTAVAPGVLRYPYLGLTYAALPIGIVVSTVVLLVIFFLLLTPLALVFKLMGRDPLQRRMNPEAKSYWHPRRPAGERRRYLRQY